MNYPCPLDLLILGAFLSCTRGAGAVLSLAHLRGPPPTLLGGLWGSRKWSCARVRASGEVWVRVLGVYFPAQEEPRVVPAPLQFHTLQG